MSGTYTMNANSGKKEMNITIIGSFSPETAEKFISDYTAKVNAIPASDYTLRLDCSDLNVVTPDLVPALEACYKLYKSSGFKKVIFEIKQKPIVKMQLNRIARQVGLNNVEIVEKAQ